LPRIPDDVKAWAPAGARARLETLERERGAILRYFPELVGLSPRGRPRKRRKPLTRVQRTAISKRMRATIATNTDSLVGTRGLDLGRHAGLAAGRGASVLHATESDPRGRGVRRVRRGTLSAALRGWRGAAGPWRPGGISACCSRLLRGPRFRAGHCLACGGLVRVARSFWGVGLEDAPPPDEWFDANSSLTSRHASSSEHFSIAS
jgi:hypothetical protein